MRKMDKLLSNFGLDNSFRTILSTTGAYIAGGSLSSMWSNMKIGEDQDLDIWVPTDCHPNMDKKQRYDYTEVTKQLFTEYLIAKDFIELPNHLGTKGGFQTYDLCLQKVARFIVNYTHSITNQKIQVIFTWDLTPCQVVKEFDMTCCQFYYSTDSPTIKHVLTTTQLKNLQDGIAYYIGKDSEERKRERIEKYVQRGYKVIWEE